MSYTLPGAVNASAMGSRRRITEESSPFNTNSIMDASNEPLELARCRRTSIEYESDRAKSLNKSDAAGSSVIAHCKEAPEDKSKKNHQDAVWKRRFSFVEPMSNVYTRRAQPRPKRDIIGEIKESNERSRKASSMKETGWRDHCQKINPFGDTPVAKKDHHKRAAGEAKGACGEVGIAKQGRGERRGKLPAGGSVKASMIPIRIPLNYGMHYKRGKEGALVEDSYKPSATRRFCENVSIVGLQEAYESKALAERIMWYVALTAACAGMTLSSYHVALFYLQHLTVNTDVETIGYMAPFPNVTICAPATMDMEKLRQEFVVPSKVETLIRKLGMDRETLMEETLAAWFIFKPPSNRTMLYAITKIIDNTIDEMLANHTQVAPTCERIISDCYFNNIPFNCCDSAKRVYFETSICYHISLERKEGLKNAAGGMAADPRRLDTSGLVVNVSTDRTRSIFSDGVASDGFHVHIGPMASPLSDPIAIPSNMDAVIALKPPVLQNERNRCRRNTSLPDMHYLQYYDPYGVRCTAEAFLNYFGSVIGCLIHALDYVVPQERMCKRQQIYAVNSVVSGDEHAAVAATFRKNADTSLNKYLRNGSCQPLCSRWTYSVLSTSYGSVRYQGDPIWERDRATATFAWSRIRIYFPASSSRVHREEPLDTSYIVFCKIGGTFSGYASISVITFAEIIAYGAMGFCSSNKFVYVKRVVNFWRRG